MSNAMYVAIRSGFVEDDGQLVEINAGRTRVAPEVLKRPGFAEFFDEHVRANGTDATRSEYRVMMPDGRLAAYRP